MENTKPAILSKTVHGIILSAVGFILSYFDRGVVSDAETAELINALFQVGGLLWAYIGRVIAKERIEGVISNG